MKRVILVIIFLISYVCIQSCREDVLVYPDTATEGAIYITSSPLGASIFLENSYTDKVTPDWLERLKSGDYFITLKLDGYIDTTLKINIESEVRRYLSVRLKENSN